MRKAVQEKEVKTNEKEVKQELNLKQAFALWKNKSKSGNEYLTGKDEIGKLVAFFNTNKKNPKEPDIRVYEVDVDGKRGRELATLWDNVSQNGKQYLTGMTDDKEKLVAFYGKKEKAPYIRAYFKDVKEDETTTEDDLPF